MSIYQVLVSPATQNKIDTIYDYIAINLQNIDAVSNIKTMIINEISSLNIFPERYQIFKTKYNFNQPIHVRIIKKIAIFYIIDSRKKLVLVEKVGYTNQDWKV